MADVLEETTAGPLSFEHIDRRLNDWARRIDDLYAATKSWLPSGWTAHVERVVRIYEAPMREVGFGPRELPVLDLARNDSYSGVIEPRGLWIVGINGRLDFRVGSARYLLIDRAEIFEKPKWLITSLDDRTNLAPYDEHTVKSVLRS